MVFEQIYRQILRAYANIRSKNLVIKRPKNTILKIKWVFERSLVHYQDRIDGAIEID